MQWHTLAVGTDILAIERRRYSVNWFLQCDERGRDVGARQNVVRNLGDCALISAKVLVWKCVIADADRLTYADESDCTTWDQQFGFKGAGRNDLKLELIWFR